MLLVVTSAEDTYLKFMNLAVSDPCPKQVNSGLQFVRGSGVLTELDQIQYCRAASTTGQATTQHRRNRLARPFCHDTAAEKPPPSDLRFCQHPCRQHPGCQRVTPMGAHPSRGARSSARRRPAAYRAPPCHGLSPQETSRLRRDPAPPVRGQTSRQPARGASAECRWALSAVEQDRARTGLRARTRPGPPGRTGGGPGRRSASPRSGRPTPPPPRGPRRGRGGRACFGRGAPACRLGVPVAGKDKLDGAAR